MAHASVRYSQLDRGVEWIRLRVAEAIAEERLTPISEPQRLTYWQGRREGLEDALRALVPPRG